MAVAAPRCALPPSALATRNPPLNFRPPSPGSGRIGEKVEALQRANYIYCPRIRFTQLSHVGASLLAIPPVTELAQTSYSGFQAGKPLFDFSHVFSDGRDIGSDSPQVLEDQVFDAFGHDTHPAVCLVGSLA